MWFFIAWYSSRQRLFDYLNNNNFLLDVIACKYVDSTFKWTRRYFCSTHLIHILQCTKMWSPHSLTWCQIVLILKWLWRSKRLQELKMMSPSLLIQGYLWILKLLFMIVRNVTSVSKATNLFEGVLWMSLSLSMSILVISYLDYYMYLNQPCELVQISNLNFYQGHKLFRSQCQRTHVYLENVGETLVSRESQDFWLQWVGDLWFIGELPVQLNV